MRITVDAELCSGQGRCYTVSPELFTSDDEGFVEPAGHRVRRRRPSDEEAARLAVASCPEGAISSQDLYRRTSDPLSAGDVDPPLVDVCVRYARALDRRDWELLATCFTTMPSSTSTGWTRSTGAARSSTCAGAPRTDSTSASTCSATTIVEVARRPRRQRVLPPRPARAGPARPSDKYVVAGTYIDRLRRPQDGWKITHRRLGGRVDGRQPRRCSR